MFIYRVSKETCASVCDGTVTPYSIYLSGYEINTREMVVHFTVGTKRTSSLKPTKHV
jgi:hypothetical protein